MRGKKMDPVSEEWLRAEYKVKTRDQISKDLGVAKGTIYRWMRLYGIEGRKRTEYVAGKKTKYLKLDDKEWLYDQYLIQKKSIHQIAEIVECTMGAVWWGLHKHQIAIRKTVEGFKERFPDGRKGKDNTNWKGGRYAGGHHQKYIMIKAPNHPWASKHGYILEHRLIMEKEIGRILEPNEFIHHINGDGKDNRIENLVLVSKREHQRIHLAANDFQQVEIDRLRKLLDENKIAY